MAEPPTNECCAQAAIDEIRKRAPDFKPKLGLILGSGMGEVAKSVKDAVVIPYSELPGFPVSTVSGHAGNLVLGTINGMNVACLQGRVHLYEGIPPSKVRVYIYALRLLGCEVLFLTSAVGSLVPQNGPGTLVCVSDHINLQGCHALVGPNDPIGPRFTDMQDAYDPVLRGVLAECAKEQNLRLPEGVYLALTGPTFETPAEIRAFRTMGADVVGMSVVQEVICARHCGMRVAALAICVNLASGIGQGQITHADTLHYTNKASESLQGILASFIRLESSWEKDPKGDQKRKASDETGAAQSPSKKAK